MVYNACRALVSQLAAGESWRPLADVVAVAICNFVLWSDKEQEARIDSCADPDQLSEWLQLALTAGSIEEALS